MNKKLYKCSFPNCTTEQTILSKKLCKYHRFKEKGSQVKKTRIKQQSAKAKEKRRDKVAFMKEYWAYHLNQLSISENRVCENCGCKISGGIANIAHLIPKRNFGGVPDIANILENCAYLCASISDPEGQGCHNRFDRIAGSSKVYLMPVWETMVKRYLTFRDKIVKYNKYSEIFNEWIEEQNEL